MAEKDLDFVGKLPAGERELNEHALESISPDDAKYRKASKKLAVFLSAAAEWGECAYVQRVLLEARVEFGQAKKENLDEFDEALKKINPLNISMIEDADPKLGGTRHDQLAVIEEIGRYVSPETKALLHPGTTSYDILDTARSRLFKRAWNEVVKLEVNKSIEKLCELAEKSKDILQVGRTHLQNTSPVTFGYVLASYAARMAERMEKCNMSFNDLRGKISGMIGTGASIDVVVGYNKSLDFEKAVLDKLGLKPDYTATQIVQKERLADCGHGLITLMHVLGDFSNDIRMLYSSAIGEVTSRDNKERLGGSSADAMKNNPINYENMCGKVVVVESGMRVLYEMIHSDFQRDLRNSVMARYQPQAMMAETYESFSRLNKALPQLSINEDRMAQNLEPVRKNPSEAMIAILRGAGWIHPKYGVGHDFVKEMGKKAQREKRPLMAVCMDDPEFKQFYDAVLDPTRRDILDGKLEKYTGSSAARVMHNINYAKEIIRQR
jgi:adenylosuccinate lyase